MIPGMNLLNVALTVLTPQTLFYFKFLSMVDNSTGNSIPNYANPVLIPGSFQPVPRRLYQQYGLNFQKDYFTFYTSTEIFDVARDVAGDQLIFENKQYQCLSNNDWFALDGWDGVLCIRVSNPTLLPFGLEQYNKNFNNGTFKE